MFTAKTQRTQRKARKAVKARNGVSVKANLQVMPELKL
jgi:hypothetical protein